MMLLEVNGRLVIFACWTRWASVTHAGSSPAGMSTLMLFFATLASCGYLPSRATGLTWVSSAPTMHRCRRVRL